LRHPDERTRYVGRLIRLGRRTHRDDRAPRTEETAADPVADSSIPDVTRKTRDAQT
jgi:hypothetical protein